MRGVVHHQNDAGHDLHRQTEGQHDAPDPHPVQVLGRGDHDRVIDQTEDGQARMQPLLSTGFWFVMVVRNSSHGAFPLTQLDRGFVFEGGDGDPQVFRCGSAADTACTVVVGTVAGAEPPAKIASTVTHGNAAQVRADADHDQPFARLVQCAILVRRVQRHIVAVLRVLIRKLAQFHGARFFDLGFRSDDG